MSILQGALTVRRYRVYGEVKDTFRSEFEEALQRYAFHEPRSAAHGEEVEGWVHVQNLLDTDFSLRDRWLVNQYLVAALRVDKRILPAKLFRAHLDKRLAAWCQENARAKAPASVRGDLREALTVEMLARTLPRVSVYEFCWNIADGWVLFGNTSDGANDRFRKRFRKTFGLELVPATPLDFLAARPELAAQLEVAGVSDIRLNQLGVIMAKPDGLESEQQEAKALPHLASEFFAWIWYTSEQRRGTLDLGESVGTVDFWVGSRISFRAVDEDKARAVVTGESPSTTLEARAALAGGKVVNDLRLVLRREEREYEVTLRGPYLDLHNVRLPAQVKSGEDEILYERMFLYDELWFLLGALYARFAEERTGADWRTDTLPSLRAWVGRGRDAEGAYSVA